jgi:hypothetical protein
LLDAETLTQGLQHFCGTEQYFKHLFGLRYTEGVAYLAKNGECYWLIDAIASHQPQQGSFRLYVPQQYLEAAREICESIEQSIMLDTANPNESPANSN